MLRLLRAWSLAACLALSAVAPALAREAGQLGQTTASYKVNLEIGPAATMLTPDQVATAKEGEVMPAMPGMGMAPSGAGAPGVAMPGAMGAAPTVSMPSMATTDQGQPVNHHIEAHILDKASGVVIKDLQPTITITDQATGALRTISNVTPMYDVKVGESDWHWGNNVYLPDGTNTVVVRVNGEQAAFPDVMGAAVQPSTPSGGRAAATPRVLDRSNRVATGHLADQVTATYTLDWQPKFEATGQPASWWLSAVFSRTGTSANSVGFTLLDQTNSQVVGSTFGNVTTSALAQLSASVDVQGISDVSRYRNAAVSGASPGKFLVTVFNYSGGPTDYTLTLYPLLGGKPE